MSEQYYIQRKPSGYLGNSPVWYAKNGQGYTAYILGAERFDKEEAERMVSDDKEKWAMWSVDEVNKRLHLVFDHQDKKRIGTDDPCGWTSGYAINPDYIAKLEQQNKQLLEALKKYANTINNMPQADIDAIDKLISEIESSK